MKYEKQFWKPNITIFQKWQKPIVKYLYTECINYGMMSREIWNYMRQVHPGIKISRASVINFLSGLVCAGYLDYETKLGKGGEHGVYTPRMTLSAFLDKVSEDVSKQLSDKLEDVKG